jgi:hypothetical protein
MLGRKPFGFFEGEAEAIRRMKALREMGLGFDRIAAQLNKEGIPTRTRKIWHGIVVNRILTGRKRKLNHDVHPDRTIISSAGSKN